MTKPEAGEVFRYSFLWKREEMQGETGGRKARPVCVAITMNPTVGETHLFIVPITTKQPLPDRLALSVPPLEAKRVGLDVSKPCWIMVDELNFDIFEKSYDFEDRTPLGTFGPSFTRQIQRLVLLAAKSGSAAIVKRPD